MANTYYSENLILDRIFGSQTLTPPATWYVGLSTTTPTQAGANVTEPSGGSYARVGVVNNKTNWGTAASGQLTNSVAISFPESTASWGTITHIIFYDAASAGNVWFYSQLSSSKAVASGTTVYFSIGSLTVSNNN